MRKEFVKFIFLGSFSQTTLNLGRQEMGQFLKTPGAHGAIFVTQCKMENGIKTDQLRSHNTDFFCNSILLDQQGKQNKKNSAQGNCGCTVLCGKNVKLHLKEEVSS